MLQHIESMVISHTVASEVNRQPILSPRKPYFSDLLCNCAHSKLKATAISKKHKLQTHHSHWQTPHII